MIISAPNYLKCLVKIPLINENPFYNHFIRSSIGYCFAICMDILVVVFSLNTLDVEKVMGSMLGQNRAIDKELYLLLLFQMSDINSISRGNA